MDTFWLKALRGTEIGLGIRAPIAVVSRTQYEMYKAISQIAIDQIRRDSWWVHPDSLIMMLPVEWQRQERPQPPEPVEEHDAITPAGLALLEKYRRPHRPWWSRLWLWLRRKS